MVVDVSHRAAMPAYLGTLADASDRVVFIDGEYQPALSMSDRLPEGVALHVSDQSMFLEVAENTQLNRPILVLHLLSDEQAVGTRFANSIHLGANSQAVIFEVAVSSGEASQAMDALVTFDLKKDAQLYYYQLQDMNVHSAQKTQHVINQVEGSVFHGCCATVGGKQVSNAIHTLFEAPKAACHLNGLYALSGEQQLENRLLLDHQVGECRSEQLYKGVLSDTAVSDFWGKVFVQEQAQKTEANQKNDTLLLGAGAMAKTQPALEIYADDVRCNHGATVGELDELALFYLRSRGLDEAGAKRVLTKAFMQAVLDTIAHQSIREVIAQRLQEKLSHV